MEEEDDGPFLARLKTEEEALRIEDRRWRLLGSLSLRVLNPLSSIVTAIVLLFLLSDCLAADRKQKQELTFLTDVELAYSEWQRRPDQNNVRKLIELLFPIYLTDGNQRVLRQFLSGIDQQDPAFVSAFDLRKDLIKLYSPWFPDEQTALTLSLLPSKDAQLLFLLCRSECTLPRGMTLALYQNLYQEIRVFFAFDLALRHRFGVFPQHEYARLGVVLHQLKREGDPYLNALHHYLLGMVQFNSRNSLEAVASLLQSHAQLQDCLQNSHARVAQKKLLSTLAEIDIILKDLREAESHYLSILRMDPQDWNALMKLSFLLSEQGKCSDPSVWIEATIRSNQEFFDIVIHCGSRELPVEEESDGPFLASSSIFNLQSSILKEGHQH